jgi:hypothetical protein
MLVCGLLTLALAGLLAATMSLPVAVAGLVALGGPAGVGSSLLFAQLKYSGASSSDVIDTRAIVSFAWVAPAAGTRLRPLHEYAATRRHRFRTDHRPGFPGTGIPRGVRRLRRTHGSRPSRRIRAGRHDESDVRKSSRPGK